MVQSEDQKEHDANKYFFILKMALDLRNNKIMVQVLSYVQVRIAFPSTENISLTLYT